MSLRGKHPYTFRHGEWANVVSTVAVKPKDDAVRACLVCVFEDGAVDYVPVTDLSNYEMRANWE